MNYPVYRIFTEKTPGFDIEAQSLYRDFKFHLGIAGLAAVRVINRYDVQGISVAEFEKAIPLIFAEPTMDKIYRESLTIAAELRVIAMEYLPGQYDQRADSAAQCIQIISGGERPEVKTAKLILLSGTVTDAEYGKLKEYCINPVETREASLDKPEYLSTDSEIPADIPELKGFIQFDRIALATLLTELGLAMSLADLEFCRDYFRDTAKRNPTLTEIRVIDTYWSDHCRHTTFLTEIDAVEFERGSYEAIFRETYRQYLDSRVTVHKARHQERRQEPVCLMDLATVAMKELRLQGLLPDVEISDENNACSIIVNAKIDGRVEPWLVMFKNETHNHPTEIEPFGGAATCLGGAIRDPLSGRVYVYQAMRVTGSGDPREKLADTLPGKLPQRKITTGAAAGYSSYGNQIGLATGQVAEIYDPGFVAKRMEIGAVIGAAPQRNVTRAKPVPGDIIILLGGRTGRDGCGGATGSSKAHTEQSLLTCGAEVQKGNPPTERKIQRLFRNPAVSSLIKKCNDFGAGGVAVAIGELAAGLWIDLDAVPKKYAGLDGTELAISESQERMAVLVAPEHVQAFRDAAAQENLEATVVAAVTANERLQMFWRGRMVVDIGRDFLNSNGAPQHTKVLVRQPATEAGFFQVLPAAIERALQNGDLKQAWLFNLERLNICCQKGLAERFDSSIGAGTVLMPFGGKYQLTPAEGMAAKLPVLTGDTDTGTLMAFGYNPDLMRWSPFHGAVYSIVEAVAKIVAMGGDHTGIRLTLQEYFEKLGTESERWGKPFAALLGAYYAQMKLGIAAIGGKDSMSGTFEELQVPPTLVAFAVAAVATSRIISGEFKRVDSKVVWIPLRRDAAELPDFAQLTRNYGLVQQLIRSGKVLAAHSVRGGGLAEALTKMCFGNQIGFSFDREIDSRELFRPGYGSLILEIPAGELPGDLLPGIDHRVIGTTTDAAAVLVNGVAIPLQEALESWRKPLEDIFPTRSETISGQPPRFVYPQRNLGGRAKRPLAIAKPRIFMPVFPGTNCEYDSTRAFERAGGIVDSFVFRNLTPEDIRHSLDGMVTKIDNAQILMIPGGFSAGDEPDGSGKFIAAVIRNPDVKEAVHRLLKERDGLILGICNGFQALIKLGLVPYGEIRDIDPHDPTLTFNTIGRHVSCLVRTRIASSLSPWLSGVNVGDVHTIAVSHGEGRFVAAAPVLERLAINGQIATQYVDENGDPSYDSTDNPNGSVAAIEGITSPDGRVFGKMGHSERISENVYKNVPGNMDQAIFASGVAYFQ